MPDAAKGVELGAALGVDLHCHSTASDGTLSPAELVSAAHLAGVHTLALTDHDTVAGLPTARAAADARGMRFINGVELSTRWKHRSIHVVGLGFDPHNASLQAGLGQLHALRQTRAAAIAAKLERLGTRGPLERVTAMAEGGQITRAHFARLLIEDGRCRDAKRAFKQILGPGKTGYVATDWPDMADAIGWISAAGGHAVLAHPFAYRLSRTQLKALLAAFVAAGGNTLEVCTASRDNADLACATNAALQHGLLASAGSDFHDPAQRWRHLGGVAPLPEKLDPVWRHLQ